MNKAERLTDQECSITFNVITNVEATQSGFSEEVLEDRILWLEGPSIEAAADRVDLERMTGVKSQNLVPRNKDNHPVYDASKNFPRNLDYSDPRML